MRRLLLYKNGETDPQLRERIGDYERWFTRILGEKVTLEVHRAFEEPHHPLDGYHGLILSGSASSLVAPDPWMDRAAELVRSAERRGVPVLGVCFGHQLIGYAWGGRVRVNPNGWEVGTVEVVLTDEGRRDPLFTGLPAKLRVNQSHRDEVSPELGPEVVRLAGGEHTPVQSIAVGAHVRGVQFHPEMDGVVVRGIINHRRHILEKDAAERGRTHTIEDLLGAVEDTPQAARVLVNFVQHFVSAA